LFLVVDLKPETRNEKPGTRNNETGLEDVMEYSDRYTQLPPYVFAELSRKKKAAIEAGRKIIDLGIGDPDRPTPKKILDFIKEEADKPENHKYPIGSGSKTFKKAVCDWMQRRFDVEVNSGEVMALIGAKDGVTHVPLAFVNPGDIVLVPDPGYPGYVAGTIMAGGQNYFMPLTAENGFLPDLDSIPELIYKKTKIMWLNYPNNPTAAMADLTFYEKAVMFAERYDFMIAMDAPYSEIYFREAPMSMLEVEGAKDRVVEFYSMSKTYNMTGWRVGFAAGGEKLISGLATVKENLDSGTVCALQEASARALYHCDKEAAEIRLLYKKRAESAQEALKELGYRAPEPRATLYMWVEVPGKYGSMEFCEKAMAEADVVITPGIGFGPSGDRYFRIALTVEEDVLVEAVKRLKKIKI
jgi:LL-diaminopimelate aminotransferase